MIEQRCVKGGVALADACLHAQFLLESAMRNYSVLTEGETIVIDWSGKK